jgi:hypothetical protein
MPIAFLNPWFWLGALALAVPVWLHLRRRREKKLVRFPAVCFLDDQPVAARRPLRMRDWLLFMCRAAALLLVVAALTWPYRRRADGSPVQESRVYILDNTFSQQAKEGFHDDRDRILKELSASGPEIQIAVVELTAVPRVVVSFGDNRATAAETVAALQPSFTRGSYLEAFRQASSLLDNSLGQRKRIILLGDNQKNQWTEKVNTLPFLRDVQVDLPRPTDVLWPNLSLSDAHAQRIFLGDKSLVNLTLKLSRVGDASKAVVRVRADGKTISEREVALTENVILVQAQWEADSTEWLRGEAIVEGGPDLLAGDNQVFFAVPPVAEGKVTLLAHSPFLRLALSKEVMRGQWAARVVEAANLSEETDAVEAGDVLCLESSYLQSADARRLVSRYLEAGRGVILLLDRVTPAIEGFLRELDFEVEGSIRPDKAERFGFVAASHRVFHPFSSPDYGNLFEVSVGSYFKIRGNRATPLVFSQQGNGLLYEAGRGKGNLFVCAFGLDREHTSWPVHPTFIPFLDLLLQAARAQDQTPVNFEPGEDWSLGLGASSSVREIVVSASGRAFTTGMVDQGRAQVRLPDAPGLYDVRFIGAKSEKVISVNPSPKESELLYVDSPEVLNTWRVDLAAAPKPEAGFTAANLAGVLQQRYWWWMVLAGLLALTAEMALLAGSKRA